MASLGINLDHIATVRQARRTVEPDPVHLALLAELGGADGITVHLREDRRHIQDRDVQLLRQTVRTRLNLEMAATSEMVAIAPAIKPDMVTLVPEKREEVTTEGGLDVVSQETRCRVKSASCKEPASPSAFCGSRAAATASQPAQRGRWVELHTGSYAEASWSQQPLELARLIEGTSEARQLGLRVNAGTASPTKTWNRSRPSPAWRSSTSDTP